MFCVAEIAVIHQANQFWIRGGDVRGESSQALGESRVGSHRAIRFLGHGGDVDRIDRHAFVEIFDQMFGQAHGNQFRGFFGGAADMRRREHLIQRQQGLAGVGRLGLQDIQGGAGDLPRFNGVGAAPRRPPVRRERS